MYTLVLVTHSWARWVVLLAVLAPLVAAVRAWRAGRPRPEGLTRLRKAFLGVLDVQFTLGVLLYVAFSPLPRAGLAGVGAAMANPVLRFYTVEHVFGMFVAVAIAHVGLARSARLEPAAQARRIVAVEASGS